MEKYPTLRRFSNEHLTDEQRALYWPILEPLFAVCPPEVREVLDGVHSPERVVSLHWNSHTHIAGRVDGLYNTTDVQYKTVGKGVRLSDYLDALRISPHQVLYRYLLRRSGEVIDGSTAILLRTFQTQKAKAAGVNPWLVQHLPATAREDELIWQTVLRPQFIGLLSARLNGDYGIKNPAACFSVLGRCPLVNHCYHDWALEDCLPEPLVNRYPELLQPGSSLA